MDQVVQDLFRRAREGDASAVDRLSAIFERVGAARPHVCQTCRHWTGDEDGDDVRTTGRCDAIRSLSDTDLEHGPLAWVYSSAIIGELSFETTFDFSCCLWTEKA